MRGDVLLPVDDTRGRPVAGHMCTIQRLARRGYARTHGDSAFIQAAPAAVDVAESDGRIEPSKPSL